MQPYLHQTQGRIRVRSKAIQQNPAQVTRHIATLNAITGVKEVIHRRYGGSVTILFDHTLISAAQLIEYTQSFGWIHADKQPDSITQVMVNSTHKLLKGLLIGSVKRSVGGPLAMVVAATLNQR